MQVGAIIIGDELMSGKRQDRHLSALLERLQARGLELAWAHYIGDNPTQIKRQLKLAFDSADVVFSFGGIGATPDDFTRQCAAEVLGRPLLLHPEAKIIFEEKFGADAYPNRVMMGEFPEGARLIPNPINRIPGFSVDSVYFLPGFPSMAWPMAEWVLDTYYAEHFVLEHDIDLGFIAQDARESDLVELMRVFVARYPDLKFSCLPSFGNEKIEKMHIEFSFAGKPVRVEEAFKSFKQAVQEKKYILLSRESYLELVD